MLLAFRKLSEDHLAQVLTWRTSPSVTTYMFTDIEGGMKQQAEWFAHISADEKSKYWVIYANEDPVGLVSLNDIDFNHRRASWAYYIGEERLQMLGAMIGPCVYHYGFDELQLHKMYGEVMGENEKVRRIHEKHGCQEVGVFRDHIYKYGRFHDVYIYEMLAEDWTKHRAKFKKYRGSFE